MSYDDPAWIEANKKRFERWWKNYMLRATPIRGRFRQENGSSKHAGKDHACTVSLVRNRQAWLHGSVVYVLLVSEVPVTWA